MGKVIFATATDFLSLPVQTDLNLILKNTENKFFSELKKLLTAKPEKIALITHENPDGDAIGSCVGLGEVLKNIGHQVTIIVPNDYPAYLQWFSSKIEIIVYNRNKKRVKEILTESETLFCLDFNEPKRTQHLEKRVLEFPGKKVLIDHHPHPTQFCHIMISEPEYSSTAELVFDVVKKSGLSEYINRNAAEALFTGIMTDTGSFSHNTSRTNMFKVVAKLMEWGIDTEKIHQAVYHNFSAQRMKLLGYSLSQKMKVFPEFRSAVIWLSQQELEEFNFQPGDAEGFVNYPLSINNIVFSALFMEKKDHTKASFRSKGNFPANLFSKEHFSGGGHMNAAGGETKLPLDEAVEMFTQLLGEYKHQLLETII